MQRLFAYRLLLAWFLILFLTGCSPARIPVPTETAQPHPTIGLAPTSAGLTPAPTASPASIDAFHYTQILDIAYAGRIWVLAADGNLERRGLVLYGSNDGGLSWEAHPIPGAQPAWIGEQPASDKARSVVFANQNAGWVYEPGLFQTEDGGNTWKAVHLDGEVAGIAPPKEGGDAWALVRSCSADLHCTYRLMFLNGELQPGTAAPGPGSFSAGGQAALLRINRQAGYVLAAGSPDELRMSIWRTADAGSTWEQLSTPCQVEGRLAADPGGGLWLLCGGGPGAGQQMKALYHSTDRGQRWETVNTTGESVGAATAASSPLPIFGYVDSLLAGSDQRLLMGLGRSTIFLSQDGGRSWGAALPLEEANPGDSSGWRIILGPDPSEFWAAVGTDLFRSSNGGEKWDRVSIK